MTTAQTLESLAEYPPLHTESREVVPTRCAAHHLNRRPQTLRGWACLESGPIRPVRLNGRLAWRVSDLRALLGQGAPSAAMPPSGDIWSMRDVVVVTGRSPAQVYRALRAGDFPAPLSTQAGPRWNATAVRDWLASQAQPEAMAS